jgi:plastocyanin
MIFLFGPDVAVSMYEILLKLKNRMMKTRNFFIIGLNLILVCFLFLNCSKNNDDIVDDPAVSNDNKVFMKNSTFSPASLGFAVGATVTWINDDNMIHTVTADDGSFDSGDIQPGATFKRTFTMPGTVPYHCTYHRGMTGSVTAGGIK